MEQIIKLPAKQVQEALENSVLFDGQIGFVYGREIVRPTHGDVEAWLKSSGLDIPFDQAMEQMTNDSLEYQREQVQELIDAMQGWVAFHQREDGFDKLAVKAVFDDDPEDGQWFVGIEDITPEKNWQPSSANEMMLGVLLENTLYELAKAFNAAQYRYGEYYYEPEDWWSPTMVAMKMMEA